MDKEIVLLGGGGHCASVIDVIEQQGMYHIKGILDIPEKVGQSLLGYPFIGTEEDVPRLLGKHTFFLVTVGQIGAADTRKRLFHLLQEQGANLPVIISPIAYVSPRAKVMEGTIVMHQAFINAGAVVGANNIVNSKALVEHDVSTGAHCHLSTGSVLNGGCHLGDEVLLGSRAALRQGVSISSRVLIGMGSVVLRDIQEAGVYVGMPVQKIR